MSVLIKKGTIIPCSNSFKFSIKTRFGELEMSYNY